MFSYSEWATNIKLEVLDLLLFSWEKSSEVSIKCVNFDKKNFFLFWKRQYWGSHINVSCIICSEITSSSFNQSNLALWSFHNFNFSCAYLPSKLKRKLRKKLARNYNDFTSFFGAFSFWLATFAYDTNYKEPGIMKWPNSSNMFLEEEKHLQL